jgi:hypothetical protein
MANLVIAQAQQVTPRDHGGDVGPARPNGELPPGGNGVHGSEPVREPERPAQQEPGGTGRNGQDAIDPNSGRGRQLPRANPNGPSAALEPPTRGGVNVG